MPSFSSRLQKVSSKLLRRSSTASASNDGKRRATHDDTSSHCDEYEQQPHDDPQDYYNEGEYYNEKTHPNEEATTVTVSPSSSVLQQMASRAGVPLPASFEQDQQTNKPKEKQDDDWGLVYRADATPAPVPVPVPVPQVAEPEPAYCKPVGSQQEEEVNDGQLILYQMSCRECHSGYTHLPYKSEIAIPESSTSANSGEDEVVDPRKQMLKTIKKHYRKVWSIIEHHEEQWTKGLLSDDNENDNDAYSISSSVREDEHAQVFNSSAGGLEFESSSLARHLAKHCQPFSRERDVLKWCLRNVRVEVQQQPLQRRASQSSGSRGEDNESAATGGNKGRGRRSRSRSTGRRSILRSASIGRGKSKGRSKSRGRGVSKQQKQPQQQPKPKSSQRSRSRPVVQKEVLSAADLQAFHSQQPNPPAHHGDNPPHHDLNKTPPTHQREVNDPYYTMEDSYRGLPLGQCNGVEPSIDAFFANCIANSTSREEEEKQKRRRASRSRSIMRRTGRSISIGRKKKGVVQ